MENFIWNNLLHQHKLTSDPICYRLHWDQHKTLTTREELQSQTRKVCSCIQCFYCAPYCSSLGHPKFRARRAAQAAPARKEKQYFTKAIRAAAVYSSPLPSCSFSLKWSQKTKRRFLKRMQKSRDRVAFLLTPPPRNSEVKQLSSPSHRAEGLGGGLVYMPWPVPWSLDHDINLICLSIVLNFKSFFISQYLNW